MGEYDEGSRQPNSEYVWLGDIPVLVLNSRSDVLIDDLDPAVSRTGTWQSERTLLGYVGTGYQTHAADASGDTYTWALNPLSSQAYRLYVRHTSAATHSRHAAYTVTHAAGVNQIVLDQQLGGGVWRLLGIFTFTPAAGHALRLAAQTDGVVSADAVKMVAVNNAADVYFVGSDHLNTPRVLQDAQFRTRWRWESDAYGDVPPNENPNGLGIVSLNLRMPGQYFDRESGLSYNYFRDYDPATGRYLQSDPIGLAGGINTYTYVGGNPISRIDPLGLDWFRPTSHPYVVGREGSDLVEPGKGIGKFIDDYVPAGHTFGTLHDALVDTGHEIGLPDWLINTTTMPGVYVLAVNNEISNSLRKLLGEKPLLVCH